MIHPDDVAFFISLRKERADARTKARNEALNEAEKIARDHGDFITAHCIRALKTPSNG